jgi:2-desacetyl-2-hydroxyethyl bacteriochlorophyllide A dehydrogenase
MTDLPEVMAAAVYQRPGEVVVEERPVPRPGPGEVLVAVNRCGICGSDIHVLLDGWGDTPGLVAGHEYTGTIVEVGEGVEGWAVGTEVVGGSSPRCGACRRCQEGKPSQCENRQSSVTGGHDGAFAEYILVNAVALLRLPPGLSARAATLAEPTAVALHGITRSGIQPGDTAMVIGAGPIGALTLAALVARGLGPVTVVEPGGKRKQLARDLGAAEVLDPSDLQIFPRWEPERIAERAAHVVFECSGKKVAMEAGFNQLRRGGTLTLVGAGVEAPTFDPNRLLLNELHIVGSYVYDKGGFEAALELLASDGFPLDRLIEDEEFPLDRITDALTGLASGTYAGKVLVVPTVSAPAVAGGGSERAR